MATTVANVKREPFDVYIGRANRRYGARQSPWANPYAIGVHGTREQVIDAYRAYIKNRPDLLARLSELEGKRLGCYCKPLACHGDVLVELIERGT